MKLPAENPVNPWANWDVDKCGHGVPIQVGCCECDENRKKFCLDCGKGGFVGSVCPTCQSESLDDL